MPPGVYNMGQMCVGVYWWVDVGREDSLGVCDGPEAGKVWDCGFLRVGGFSLSADIHTQTHHHTHIETCTQYTHTQRSCLCELIPLCLAVQFHRG